MGREIGVREGEERIEGKGVGSERGEEVTERGKLEEEICKREQYGSG